MFCCLWRLVLRYFSDLRLIENVWDLQVLPTIYEWVEPLGESACTSYELACTLYKSVYAAYKLVYASHELVCAQYKSVCASNESVKQWLPAQTGP